MNIGLMAMRAAPKLCRSLRNVGMWPMTKQDLFDALKNHPLAPAAIFWWCHCWHGGVGTDLYRIMCDDSLGYIPDPNVNATKDPEIVKLLMVLDQTFGPLVENALLPVKLKDVQEGQILIHDGGFPCLPLRWPCRVYRWHGSLGVECSILHGVKLAAGTSKPFHPLQEDERGYVVGFQR